MAENKPTNRERLREITDGIEQGIKELFESEKYMSYLSVMSSFHRYSVNNTMLIYMQKPDATLAVSYTHLELLTPEQMEMYQVYRQTMGNKPLLFGCLLYTSAVRYKAMRTGQCGIHG